MAFARDGKAPGAGFFTCQHHFPENFWNPEFQRHDNKATEVGAVVLAAPHPSRHARFLSSFTGVEPQSPGNEVLSFPLAQGQIDVMTPDVAGEAYGSVAADPEHAAFVAFGIRVEDLDRQARWLDAARIPYGRMGSRLVVPASVAFGVAIAFEAT